MIQAEQAGAEIQPKGEVLFRLSIPETFGPDVALYDAAGKQLNGSSKNGKPISVPLNRSDVLVLCKLNAEESKPAVPDWVWIVEEAGLKDRHDKQIQVLLKKSTDCSTQTAFGAFYVIGQNFHLRNMEGGKIISFRNML